MREQRVVADAIARMEAAETQVIVGQIAQFRAARDDRGARSGARRRREASVRLRLGQWDAAGTRVFPQAAERPPLQGNGDVVAAIERDVPSWLEIVCEVEPMFGPMPDFEETYGGI